ncbi:hypothetical protein GCM10009111_27330 [Colwellia asteriadis]|uniref:Lipoprotein n=1 Tax=Colwellia asteriadis TaxID=517723 RepID=A0ABN1L9E7_9GAMM
MKIITLSDLIVGVIMMLACIFDGYKSAHLEATTATACDSSAERKASVIVNNNHHITCAKVESAHLIQEEG